MLKGTSNIGTMIRDEKTYQIYSAMQIGRSQGMQTFDEALKDLLRRDQISAGDGVHGRAEEGRLRVDGQRRVPGPRKGVMAMQKIDRFLKLMNDRGASDFHLTVGRPPMLRASGSMEIDPLPHAHRGRFHRDAAADHAGAAVGRVRDDRRRRLLVRDPGRGALSRESLPAAARRRRGLPRHPDARS